MLIAKFAAIETLVVAATFLDEQAQRIVLLAAAAGAIAILWRKVIVPIFGLLKHGLIIVKKTAAALDALEHLPNRWQEQERRDVEKDQRISSVEAEVGIVQATVADMQNDVKSIRRHLGVGDDQVRSIDS